VPRNDEDDQDWNEDEDDYGNDRGGNDLVKQLRQQIKEQSRQIRELSTENTGLKGSVRQRTVEDVLREKGLPPKVAGLIPQDIDPSSEAVSEWVNNYADVFGFSVQPSAEQAESTPEASAMQRMSRVESDGSPATGTDALQQKLASAQNQAELMALLQSAKG
jgi:hypothetical protein